MSETFKFGFEEADPEDLPRRRPSLKEDTFVGRDAAGVVTVAVDETARVRQVTLDRGWREALDPRRLGAAVVEAANDATLRALVNQAERPPTTTTPPTPPTDEPITPAAAQQLLDAVHADLDAFTRRLAGVVDRDVAVTSRGGHVHGTARTGRVLDLSVDPHWARRARDSEIGSELLDVLAALHARSTPGELASGPHSAAISELTALLSDPQTLLRRLGLTR
ncbi:YbaB/EbfC family nucleoid-associated protein [Saccharothrix sp.]|uniref:YbaB/EbfC family nucleoid-associated protein n=1 Tax=Saccharothrix sp. TaxID=1873460 RepID=UPI002812686A|nr:YbaB/EbfC family nucleoid-associated protein [Saccharothrix sp.]